MRLVTGLLLAMLLAARSTSPIMIPDAQQYAAQSQPAPKSGDAIVYFYNHPEAIFDVGIIVSKVTVGPARYAILEGDQDGKELAVIGCGHGPHLCAGTYTWIEMPAGDYDFTAMFIQRHGNGITEHVHLQAGQMYYFKVQQSPAVYSQDIRLLPVPQQDALLTLEHYKYCPGWTCDEPGDDSYRNQGQ